jgi:hypothetical protein
VGRPNKELSIAGTVKQTKIKDRQDSNQWNQNEIVDAAEDKKKCCFV